jgi:eukaryotic-like serine/threonine-protein kinase
LVPAFAWPHLNRGVVLARAGRLPDARAAYESALAANPRFIEALVNRGLVCLELDDLAQAERDFNRAVALGRRDLPLLIARAELKARLGQRAPAQRDYVELLSRHPKDAALLVAYGFFLLSEPGDSARGDAALSFKRALELDPRQARAHLGLAYLRRGADPSAALAEANLALDADPDCADALQLRALLRARLGDRGALADVDLLIRSPTPHRLYNAACALAVLAKTDSNPELISRSLDLLHRAIDSGFPAARLAQDPDLSILKNRVEFKNMIKAGQSPDG